MNKGKQTDLFKQEKRGRPRKRPIHSFGGQYCAGYNPSMKRPMDSKKALHVVLHSKHAKKERSFKSKAFEGEIYRIISRHAKKCGIRLYDFANAGNHLHLLIRIHDRQSYAKFIRAISGLIARLVLGAQRGEKSSIKEKFWNNRPFSRVVSFGRDYNTLRKYLMRNVLEILGWIKYLPRNKAKSAEWRNLYKMCGIASLE